MFTRMGAPKKQPTIITATIAEKLLACVHVEDLPRG
jgi:hypothetical protein